MVEHYVLMKAVDGRTAELEVALRTFVGDIVALDTVIEASAGPNINAAALERGWTHGMHVRLRSPEDLPGYWEHPHHVRLVETLQSTTSDRFAMDHETPSTL